MRSRERSGKQATPPIIFVLNGLVVALAIALVAGTALALATKKDPAGPVAPAAPTEKPAVGESTGTGYFTGIGTIRVESAGKPPAAIVVSVAFPYDPSDLAFSEELASKTKRLREETTVFFSEQSAADLRRKPESELKELLMQRYNGILRLGRIKALFFNDYLLID